MNERNEYRTRDLYEASYLRLHCSVDFLRVDKDGRDCWFVFRGSCKTSADKYYGRQTSVDAKQYADAIRESKDLIFAHLRARGL